MSTIVRRLVLTIAFFVAIGAVPVGESLATACPNCKAANETDSLKPRAYMYSILFMIGMPAMIFTGFSLSFWQMSRKAKREQHLAAEETAAGQLSESLSDRFSQ